MREAQTSLVVRRTIFADAERLFAAWTEAEQLMQWWGPGQIVCHTAEVDLRVGGHYRIANRMPDGSLLWIEGVFEHVERPRRLVYTWRIAARPAERVTVRFEPRGNATEVIVVHDFIPDPPTRDRHEAGWNGCLAKLDTYAGRIATLMK